MKFNKQTNEQTNKYANKLEELRETSASWSHCSVFLGKIRPDSHTWVCKLVMDTPSREKQIILVPSC